MKRYDVPRYINQELFNNILLDIVEDEFDNQCEDIINDTFELRHYDWDADDWPNEKPNFYHKPSGYKLWWYKYPLRSAEANMKISIKQFTDILYDCREAYVNRVSSVKISYNIGNKKWWKKKNKLKNINSRKK